MTIAGMSRANLDAVRDGCELHLHEETGGVFMTIGEEVIYIAPMAITSAELVTPLASTPHPSTPIDASQQPEQQPPPRNLADSVLEELHASDVGGPKSSPLAAARRRRK